MKEWITGRNPVYEVLRAERRNVFRLWVAKGVEPAPRLNEILRQAQKRHLKIENVPRTQLDRLGENHQGIAIEVSGYPYRDFQDILALAEKQGNDLLVLILDRLQNPQNFGTLLRTAEATGVHGVILPLARTVTVTPAVVHASAGASEHLFITQMNLAQALNALKAAGVWVVGLEESSEAKHVEDMNLNGPMAVVVGNEGEGIRQLIRRSCDEIVRLPMIGKIESLNAAVAGSIILYKIYLSRQK